MLFTSREGVYICVSVRVCVWVSERPSVSLRLIILAHKLS